MQYVQMMLNKVIIDSERHLTNVFDTANIVCAQLLDIHIEYM